MLSLTGSSGAENGVFFQNAVALPILEFIDDNPLITVLAFAALPILVALLIVQVVRRRQSTRIFEMENAHREELHAKDKRLSEVLMNEYEFSTIVNLDTMQFRRERVPVYAQKVLRDSEGDYAAEFSRLCKSCFVAEDVGLIQVICSPEGLLHCKKLNDMSVPTVQFRAVLNGSEMWIRLAVYFAESAAGSFAYLLSKNATKAVLTQKALEEAQREREKQIAELQALKSSLEDALAVAQEANLSKSRFLSQMSHEIRTPMNAIIGYMTIAQNAPEDRDKCVECLGKAENAAKHLLDILNDILDMSAIESGKINLSLAPFDFKETIALITEMFYSQATDNGIHFEVILSADTVEILVGDRLRVHQILINLLSNAVKFTPRGGTVTVFVEQRVLSENTVQIRFRVSDTGIGIEEDFIGHIFEPFSQKKHVAKNMVGTGLGLPICKNLISMMNGSICVKSKVGVGTEFTVDIPFRFTEEPACTKHLSVDFSHLTALVADDEPSACEFLKKQLERCGIAVTAVFSGTEALGAISAAGKQNRPYDLCILDRQMPDPDGVETARRIRTLCGCDTPFLILTSYDSAGVRKKAMAAGVDLVIAKPLFQSTLFDLLVTRFGKPNAYSPPPKKSLSFSGKRVLLAEDNPMNREIAVEILKDRGFSVQIAENGRTAYETFTASPGGYFDLILMDIMMPEMDGYEATRAIRESTHADARKIPILAMTANAFSEDISAAFNAGMNGHIAKPIDIEKMFDAISVYI